jgi:excisionase family DNA binding protein
MPVYDTSKVSNLLTKEQASTYLGVSISTLNRLVSEGVIKSTKLRRFVRFKKEDLDNPIQKASQTT